MAVGQFQISGLVQGSPNPQLVLPPYYIPSATSNPEIIPVTLANGDNSITVTKATTNGICILVPPNYAWPTPSVAFAGVLTIKGVSGDTGYVISNTWPTTIALAPTSSTTLHLNSTATGTMNLVVA